MLSDTDRVSWRMPRHLDGEVRLAIFSVDEFLILSGLLFGGILSGTTLQTLPVMLIGIPLLRKAKTRYGGSFSVMALVYWFTPVHIKGFPASWKRVWRG